MACSCQVVANEVAACSQLLEPVLLKLVGFKHEGSDAFTQAHHHPDSPKVADQSLDGPSCSIP